MAYRGHRIYNIVATMALLFVLLGTVVMPGTVSAGRAGCRGDPVFILRDGTAIDITTDIGTEVWNVQRIEYVIHAPVGSRVLSATYTNGLLGIRERMTFYADAPDNRYTTDVMVYTAGGASVSATSTVVKLLGVATRTVSGTDRQHLTVQLNP
jgi:hypothetical protein